MTASHDTLFEDAIGRYQQGAPAAEVLEDFRAITTQAPQHSAGWTCLAWLQLLNDQPEEALRSARTAVKLNPQDPSPASTSAWPCWKPTPRASASTWTSCGG